MEGPLDQNVITDWNRNQKYHKPKTTRDHWATGIQCFIKLKRIKQADHQIIKMKVWIILSFLTVLLEEKGDLRPKVEIARVKWSLGWSNSSFELWHFKVTFLWFPSD